MNINAEKAKDMMENLEEFVLLDARSEEEFSEGHIPGAIVIPHEEISEREIEIANCICARVDCGISNLQSSGSGVLELQTNRAD